MKNACEYETELRELMTAATDETLLIIARALEVEIANRAIQSQSYVSILAPAMSLVDRLCMKISRDCEDAGQQRLTL